MEHRTGTPGVPQFSKESCGFQPLEHRNTGKNKNTHTRVNKYTETPVPVFRGVPATLDCAAGAFRARLAGGGDPPSGAPPCVLAKRCACAALPRGVPRWVKHRGVMLPKLSRRKMHDDTTT